MKWQFYIGTMATTLCLFQFINIGIVQADECLDVADGCLKVNTEALKKITFDNQEIMPDGQIVKSGDSTVQETIPDKNLDLSNLPTVTKSISQKIDNLWQLEVPVASKDKLNPNCIISEPLIHSSQDNSIIPVEIECTKPTEIGESTNQGKVIMQGGAILHFNLSNIQASGTYSGNLKITIIESP